MSNRKDVYEFMKTVENHLLDLDHEEREMLNEQAHKLFNAGVNRSSGKNRQAGVKLSAVREVHRSNMSKLGGDGKPVLREDGKVLKGPG